MSNNPFGNLTTDGLEESEDRLGGFSTLESDVYGFKIKAMYAGQSAKGARSVTFLGVDQSGKEYRETIFVTNRDGQNYFLNKDDKSKKVPLPGFTIINDICLVVTGKPLSEQATEEKLVNQWDNEQRKEVPKAAPVLVDLTGKDVLLAVKKNIVDKTKQEGDERVPTGETREENTIEKVFHPELRITVVEATEAQKKDRTPVPGFIDAWIERNKGKVFDKSQAAKDGTRQGRPGAKNNSGPPKEGDSSAPRKPSLFGN